MHVVYGMGRLCCIVPTLVYYSKRLCLTTWPRWQSPSLGISLRRKELTYLSMVTGRCLL
jgi:hypothetical protein